MLWVYRFSSRTVQQQNDPIIIAQYTSFPFELDLFICWRRKKWKISIARFSFSLIFHNFFLFNSHTVYDTNENFCRFDWKTRKMITI